MSELVGRFEVSFLENACCRIIRLIRHKGLRTVFHGGMRDDLSLSKFLPSDSLRLPLDDLSKSGREHRSFPRGKNSSLDQLFAPPMILGLDFVR